MWKALAAATWSCAEARLTSDLPPKRAVLVQMSCLLSTSGPPPLLQALWPVLCRGHLSAQAVFDFTD